MELINFIPASIGISGLVDIYEAQRDAFKNNFLAGCSRICHGLAKLNLSTYLYHVPNYLKHNLIKCTLMVGCVSEAVEGSEKALLGIKSKTPHQIIEGIARVSSAAASAYILSFMHRKISAAMQEAALVALPSYYIAKSGVQNLFKHQYKRGIGKLLLGATGIGCSLYYLFAKASSPVPNLVPEDIKKFASEHQMELESLCPKPNKHEMPSLKPVGAGVSKMTYVHPELANYVVKAPNEPLSYWGGRENDIQRQISNMQEARDLVAANQYSRLVIPKTYLIETASCPISVEERIDCENHYFPLDEDLSFRDSAKKELGEFLREGGFKDIVIEDQHNACFLRGKHLAKIGVFDLDADYFL